jgi:predicted TPR repeat methyltransferase/Tfp pilus assembly protein PilF
MNKATDAAAPQSTDVTVNDLVAYAITYLQAGEIGEAEGVLKAILEELPDHPDALHYLGICRHHRGESEEALNLVRRSITLVPDFADFHNNLGNILFRLKRHEEALESYDHVIRLKPRHAEAFNNRGIVLRWLKRDEEAEKSWRRAIAINPQMADAMFNLARKLMDRRQVDQAVALLRHALRAGTEHANTCRTLLAHGLGLKGDREGLTLLLQEWTASEKDNATAQHLLAANGDAPAPDRASDDYIVDEFDTFAKTFDVNLWALGYRAPEVVAGLLARAIGEPKGDLVVLDAGCGTGLCGPLVKPHARRLIGMDLSREMLARAVNRGYDRLEAAELTAYLEKHPAAFDAVIAADVFCYFGALLPAFAAARASLRGRGPFVFTVERWPDAPAGEPFHLQRSGRYRHSEEAIRRVLGEAGFVIEAMNHETLRLEFGEPVLGLAVLARPAG